MILKLYNTLTRKKEAFKPLKKTVGLYTCGQTVYNYAHIGNLRTYIFEDLLKRTLLYNKHKVKHVMNITDVGHLTSDQDTGEDKMAARAKREGKTAWKIAKFYTKAFRSDLKKMNILPPDIWCVATEHIKEQIAMIKALEKNGFTYKIEDGIYFNTSKLKSYGKLTRLDIKGLKAGARVNIGGKKHKTDFALWKFSPSNEKRDMEWSSPWSAAGFPGWHIECSAMSAKYLGLPFDIHCGGIDHAPIHHTNEMAQIEGATGKEQAKTWMHGEFLIINQEKMGKSKGNFITLATLEEKGFSPEEYRYFLLNAHYRMQLNFSFSSLESAKHSLTRLRENVQTFNKDNKKNTKNKYENDFLTAINDDLNMPQALAITWKVIRDKNLANKEKKRLVKKFDEVLGLNIFKKEKKLTIPKEVLALAKQREAARKKKDFKESDRLRSLIKKKGFAVEDTPAGFRIKK